MESQDDGVAATSIVGETEVSGFGCAGRNHAIIYRTGRESEAAGRLQGNDEIVRLSGPDIRDSETDGHVFTRIDNSVSGSAAFGDEGRTGTASHGQLASG